MNNYICPSGPDITFVFIIALLLIGAIWAVFPRVRSTRRGAQPVLQSDRIWRVLAIAVGIFIVALIAYSTWANVRETYSRRAHLDCKGPFRPMEDVNVRLPVSEPPATNSHASGGRLPVTTSGTLSVCFVLLHRMGPDVRYPIASSNVGISWPTDRGKRFSATTGAGEIHAEFAPRDLWYENRDSTSVLVMDTEISLTSETWHRQRELLCNGPFDMRGQGICRIPLWSDSYSQRELALAPLGAQIETYELWCLGGFAQPGAAIREQKAADVLLPRTSIPGPPLPSSYPFPDPQIAYMTYDPPGAAFFRHFQSAIVMLLGAVILIGRAFRRSTVATAILLVISVFYVAALDRNALNYYLSRASDSKAPLYSRLIATRLADHTFFFKKTEARALRQLADDPACPDLLRHAARDYTSQKRA